MTISSTRVAGVDLARLLALVSIMVVHLLPATSGAHTLAAGRSAALFALLAGVALAITSARGRTHRAQVARALLVAAIGLTLGLSPGPIAVILVNDGVLFLLAIPFLRLGQRALALSTITIAVLGPVLSMVLRQFLPAFDGSVPSWVSLAHPLELLIELLLTGYYPALPWLAYVLTGLLVGRMLVDPPAGTAQRRLPLKLVATGAALTLASWLLARVLEPSAAFYASRTGDTLLAGRDLELALGSSLFGVAPADSWWWLLTDAPYSSTTLDLARSGGGALLALGLVLLAPVALGARMGILTAMGSMTLTLYTLHVLISGSPTAGSGSGTAEVVTQILVLLGFVGLWRFLVKRPSWRRGPLEGAVSLVVTRADRTPRR